MVKLEDLSKEELINLINDYDIYIKNCKNNLSSIKSFINNEDTEEDDMICLESFHSNFKSDSVIDQLIDQLVDLTNTEDLEFIPFKIGDNELYTLASLVDSTYERYVIEITNPIIYFDDGETINEIKYTKLINSIRYDFLLPKCSYKIKERKILDCNILRLEFIYKA